MDPTHAPPPLPPPFLLPPLQGQGEGRKKGGGRGGEVSGGKGGPGFHPVPPFPRPTLPHLWARLPNFGASVVFIARAAQRSEKTIEAAYLFFYNSKLN
jgi:hypothetical protein